MAEVTRAGRVIVEEEPDGFGCSGNSSGSSDSSETFGIVGGERGMGYCEFCGLRSCPSYMSRVEC